jgi:hypothetical protein
MARAIRQMRGRLPLKSKHLDPKFWAKVTALWHRERMRQIYISTGVESAEARHRANREALEIAQKNGWRGQLPQLKAALSELVVNELPGRGRVPPGQKIRFWEEYTHRDVMAILRYPPDRLQRELVDYLKEDVASNGRYAGRVGFYRLTHLIGFMPTTEHMAKREAFLRALNEVGYDPHCADREIYRVVLRLLQPNTHRPFETRLGEPMPSGGFRGGVRRAFGLLSFRSRTD